MITLSRRMVGTGLALGASTYLQRTGQAQGPGDTLVVTNSTGRTVSFVDTSTGIAEHVDVGHAPWGIVAANDEIAFVSTAEGVAVVDLIERRFETRFPYRTSVASLSIGEYRPGGMGIAVDADLVFVYVAVYTTNGPSVVEVMNAETGDVEAVYDVGERPFQVLMSPSGESVYSIDHDSFTVTVFDVASGTTEVIAADPMGIAGFDKPHYAAFDADGMLVMPYQGNLTIRLDLDNGEYEAVESMANTHQHGIARIGDSDRYVAVGTGAAGSATGGPNVSIIDMTTGEETIWPLALPHEDVVISADGMHAYLTGGYSFQNAGWDGISRVNLATGEVAEFEIPERPLGIVRLGNGI